MTHSASPQHDRTKLMDLPMSKTSAANALPVGKTLASEHH
jgi:hypothetical protein